MSSLSDAAKTCLIESLEDRRLLSVSFSGGVLTITGTGRADEIEVERHATRPWVLRICVNGEVEKMRIDKIASILCKAGGGDDEINFNSADRVTLGSLIRGGNGDDLIIGGAGPNTIRGGCGDDTITGCGGRDDLDGEEDNDDLDGGAGDDVVKGGRGRDKVHGGKGHDKLHGGRGCDHFFGDDDEHELEDRDEDDWYDDEDEDEDEQDWDEAEDDDEDESED